MTMNAAATWQSPAGGSPRTYVNCRIQLNSRIAFGWRRLCTAIGHEVGLLLGRSHTRRAGRFMSETYRRPARKCRR